MTSDLTIRLRRTESGKLVEEIKNNYWLSNATKALAIVLGVSFLAWIIYEIDKAIRKHKKR